MIEELVRRLGIENMALLDRGDGNAACRVLYVVDRRDSARPAGTTQRGPGSVGMWAWVFDDAYSVRPADPTFDTSSWQSRVSGEDFGEEEMRDWVTGAVARIRALGGRYIYEIGCGTGLLLWQLINGCDHYRGSDISSVAVKRLRRELERRGVEHARIDQGEATDIADLRVGGVDTIVINSVTQYFPSQEYLRLEEGGEMLQRDAPYVQIIEHYRREIAAEFGVSLATASEVATGLQALGLVTPRPGAGTVVTAPRPRADRVHGGPALITLATRTPARRQGARH